MDTLDMHTATVVIRACQDEQNPTTQAEAQRKRDEWLSQIQAGWLEASEPVAQVLASSGAQ